MTLRCERLNESRGVKYAIDPVGGETGSQVFQSLGEDGRMLVYGVLSEQPISIEPRSMIAGKRVIEGFWLGHFMLQQSIPSSLLLFRDIARQVRAGVLSSEIGSRFPLEGIVEAAAAAEKVGRKGKVLLTINSA